MVVGKAFFLKGLSVSAVGVILVDVGVVRAGVILVAACPDGASGADAIPVNVTKRRIS